MSSTTGGVAVAVSASTPGRPSASTAVPISRKAGRKSKPHCDRQCASSTTSNSTGRAPSAAMNPAFANCSGVENTIRARPPSIASRAAASSLADRLLCSATASMPNSASASHWSFISAISGEITSVRPAISTAGNW